MAEMPDALTIGEVAERSGVAPSALRFYEEKGLISSHRNAGNQRRYDRAVLRRVALIRVAQGLGLSLADIAGALDTLPHDTKATLAHWQQLSRRWRTELDSRIAALTQLRDELDSCIGCGCLSLQKCRLYNRGDKASAMGAGPRYLLGDRSSEVPDLGD